MVHIPIIMFEIELTLNYFRFQPETHGRGPVLIEFQLRAIKTKSVITLSKKLNNLGPVAMIPIVLSVY